MRGCSAPAAALALPPFLGRRPAASQPRGWPSLLWRRPSSEATARARTSLAAPASTAAASGASRVPSCPPHWLPRMRMHRRALSWWGCCLFLCTAFLYAPQYGRPGCWRRLRKRRRGLWCVSTPRPVHAGVCSLPHCHSKRRLPAEQQRRCDGGAVGPRLLQGGQPAALPHGGCWVLRTVGAARCCGAASLVCPARPSLAGERGACTGARLHRCLTAAAGQTFGCAGV